MEEKFMYQKPQFVPKESSLLDIMSAIDKDKLKIERTLNGVIVEYPNDNDGNFPKKEVIEFDEVNKNGVRYLLFNIVEWLGEGGDKYDKENIVINIVHGRGFECKDKKCDICGNECSIRRKK